MKDFSVGNRQKGWFMKTLCKTKPQDDEPNELLKEDDSLSELADIFPVVLHSQSHTTIQRKRLMKENRSTVNSSRLASCAFDSIL